MKKYPKEILDKIKSELLTEKEKLEVRLRNLNEDDPFSNPDRLNDNAASDTEAKEEIDHERIEALKQTINNDLKSIEESLVRIQKGNFGFCENCKEMIDTDRLGVYPTVKYCIKCQKLQHPERFKS